MRAGDLCGRAMVDKDALISPDSASVRRETGEWGGAFASRRFLSDAMTSVQPKMVTLLPASMCSSINISDIYDIQEMKICIFEITESAFVSLSFFPTI